MTKIARDGTRVPDWYDEEPLTLREALIGYGLIAGAWLLCAGPVTWLAGVML
jgi:hypothetical protein